MATLKAVRKRIASVRSTEQITRAMKMVAAAKLRRAEEAARGARPFAEKAEELLAGVLAGVGAGAHPLLARRREERIEVLLITADRGLCGAYNANLIRRATAFIAEHGEAEVSLNVVGRKGLEYFRRRGARLAGGRAGALGGAPGPLARELAGELSERFVSGKTDAVYLIYSHYRSALSQVPVVEQLLPVRPPERGGNGAAREYIYEPDRARLLGELLPRYVELHVMRALLEAAGSEHGARMTAMENATRNAGEMIARLTLAMNRARQAAITKELMEIVSGAEALKG